MIPPFDEHGYLPPGIHPATLDEIAARFGRESELRRVQMESIRWLVDLARKAGVQRIVLNGSFVTDAMEPNDVDCALLVEAGFPSDLQAEAELLAGLPFLDIDIAREDGWDEMVGKVFAADRHFNPKGMIEVIQWT
jgi:predicted nucleotidyltransferase